MVIWVWDTAELTDMNILLSFRPARNCVSIGLFFQKTLLVAIGLLVTLHHLIPEKFYTGPLNSPMEQNVT